MTSTRAIILGVALLTRLTALGAGPAPPRPNILYLCIEDTGPFLGCYGHPEVKTPRIDSFAREAVLFTDAHCQVALCTPSRTSILTGVRPSTSGIVKIDDDWRASLPGVTSLPRHLRNHGYHTRSVGKIYDPRSGGMDDAFDIDDPARLTSNERPLAALREAAQGSQPFFLGIGYAQAHLPWEPTPEALAVYEGAAIVTAGMSRNFRGTVLDDATLASRIRDYYAAITDVDRLIGEMLDEARALGLLENTIILVGAMDHGFDLGWHGRYGKSNTSDPETLVPLIVRPPGAVVPGRRCSALVELVDLYPTLLELCDLPGPRHELEGTSFVPLLHNPDLPWKTAVFAHRAYDVNIVAVKTRDYYLLRQPGQVDQLFDRRTDPHSVHDIAADSPEIVRELSAIASAGWTAARPHSLTPNASP